MNKDIFGRENRIILTTRPIGYEWMKDRIKYEYLRILPFDEERIKEYIEEDYKNIQFQAILTQNRELLGVPILLKMVKTLLEEKKLFEIKNRTELYQKFIKDLFEKWEAGRQGISDAPIEAITIQKDLQIISFEAIKNGKLGFVSLKRGLEYLDNDKNRMKGLKNWSVTHNLIERGEEKVIAYTHQSFQEYLAAMELKGKIFEEGLRINDETALEFLEYQSLDEVWLFLIGALTKTQAKMVIRYIQQYDPYLATLSLTEYKGERKGFQDLIDWVIDKGILHNDKKAWEVLVKIADSEIEKRLIGLLKNKNPIVQGSAARALGAIKSESAVMPLIGLLKDEDSDVRGSAASALGKMKSESAPVSLIGLLKDEKFLVREGAVLSLGEISSGIDPDKQSELVLELSNLAKKNKKYANSYLKAIDKIKSATGRRFIKELGNPADKKFV